MNDEELYLSFRIKTPRRRKRLQKYDAEKKLLSLYGEREKVYKQIANLGYEPLIPPIQRGWKRFFVLRDDVRRSPRATFFDELLKKINTTEHSRDKSFKVKKRRKGKRKYIARQQELRSYYEYEWTKLKLSPEQALYFTEVHCLVAKKFMYKKYVFNEPWRFVLKIALHMITMVKVTDNVLEQRIKELDHRLDYSFKLRKIIGGHRWMYWHLPNELKCKNPLHNKPLHKILEECYD